MVRVLTYGPFAVERHRDVDCFSAFKGTNTSDYDDEPMIPQTKSRDKSREVERKSLSTQQLQELVESDISHVASIVGLEVHHMSILVSTLVNCRLRCTPLEYPTGPPTPLPP